MNVNLFIDVIVWWGILFSQQAGMEILKEGVVYFQNFPRILPKFYSNWISNRELRVFWRFFDMLEEMLNNSARNIPL